MNKMRKFMLLINILWVSASLNAQNNELTGKSWKADISGNGCLNYIVYNYKAASDTVFFNTVKGVSGPRFYINMGRKDTIATWKKCDEYSYSARLDDVVCQMSYIEYEGLPAIKITLSNNGHVPFQPVKAGIKLGIDAYMDKYPEWMKKYFPTLLYNEKTHFWGYMQSPNGNVLGIFSRQPIASWSIDYNLGYQDPKPHWFMGHRLLSVNLDLLNALPLPDRNPQNLWALEQGEQKTWIISLASLHSGNIFKEIYDYAHVPMIQIKQTSYSAKDTAAFKVYADNPRISVTDDSGNAVPLSLKQETKNLTAVSCELPAVGLYNITVHDGDKTSKGIITVHNKWQWCMEQAREATLKYKQKATSHAESWYGFYSAFIAAKYFPDKEIDDKVTARFDYLYDRLHDARKVEPKYYKGRIQNTSTTIGMLVDKYQAHHDSKDIENASRLADWLIKFSQAKNGAYMNGNTNYTSVIYIAKSLMELYLEERELGRSNAGWKHKADRHYKSIKKAVDQLIASQGNFETEGEMTFEDGMISCSALQIGMFALLQNKPELQRHYTNAMLIVLKSHDCLAQLQIPDARRRGGTMRYWEAQYDVQMLPNMFNSPHGWSAWRAYATYYAYLLTGDEKWINETYNAMGAFSNLLDYKTGKLHWAFVVDPYVRAEQTCSPDTTLTADSLSFGNPHPELYPTKNIIIGEQYVNMISDWQTVNTQDNDVHEVFKCLGETMLCNAFVIEKENGEIKTYNCNVTKNGSVIIIHPSESQITNIHCSLLKDHTLIYNNKKKTVRGRYFGWAFGTDPYKI
jgi:hypothetical protein